MNWFNDFISLLYPRLCVACDEVLLEKEEQLCFFCLIDLPYSFYIDLNENPVNKLFYGRINFQFASSFIEFEKGNKCQKIIHSLKYKNNPKIGEMLGREMGKAVIKSSYYNDIQGVVPVPLHKGKQKKRGYNQSSYIGKGIADILDVTLLENVLERNVRTTSQTKKRRYERWENVESVFQVCKEKLKNIDHILLVDDVVTTGATLEACGKILQSEGDVKVSVITLARSG